jgi:GTP pyrophosphokinase
VNEETKRAVQLVTKTAAYYRADGTGEAEYYNSIAENDIAIMVKILDRVNNISAMAGGFTREKMLSYIVETEELIYPLIDKAKATWDKYEHPVFLIEYQMKTMIESLKRVL